MLPCHFILGREGGLDEGIDRRGDWGCSKIIPSLTSIEQWRTTLENKSCGAFQYWPSSAACMESLTNVMLRGKRIIGGMPFATMIYYCSEPCKIVPVHQNSDPMQHLSLHDFYRLRTMFQWKWPWPLGGLAKIHLGRMNNFFQLSMSDGLDKILSMAKVKASDQASQTPFGTWWIVGKLIECVDARLLGLMQVLC